MGPFHRRVLRLVALGMFFDTFDNSLAAGIFASLVQSGWSTLPLNAHFISATFVALSVGAAMAGVLATGSGAALPISSICWCSVAWRSRALRRRLWTG